jgi:hypothetical protein
LIDFHYKVCKPNFSDQCGSTIKWCFGDDESQLGDYAWYDGLILLALKFIWGRWVMLLYNIVMANAAKRNEAILSLLNYEL